MRIWMLASENGALRGGKVVTVDPSRLQSVHPVGMFPTEGDLDEPMPAPPLHYKKRYTVNEVNLMGQGDILLLSTDGLTEHARGEETYAPARLEETVRRVKDHHPADIITAVKEDLLRFAPLKDDASIVVIKRAR